MHHNNDGIQDTHPVLVVLKGDVTWDNLEQQFLVQRNIATLLQHCFK